MADNSAARKPLITAISAHSDSAVAACAASSAKAKNLDPGHLAVIPVSSESRSAPVAAKSMTRRCGQFYSMNTDAARRSSTMIKDATPSDARSRDPNPSRSSPGMATRRAEEPFFIADTNGRLVRLSLAREYCHGVRCLARG